MKIVFDKKFTCFCLLKLLCFFLNRIYENSSFFWVASSLDPRLMASQAEFMAEFRDNMRSHLRTFFDAAVRDVPAAISSSSSSGAFVCL